MSKSNFVHLHTHSHYSLLDGASTVEDLVKEAAGQGMPALALTDHGNLFGAINFYQAAQKEGIKPIIGCEVYIAPGKRTEKKGSGNSQEHSYHLTLLVRNDKGYQNLIKLVTLAYKEGFYYKPRIDKELLAQLSEGLVCLSGCLHSELATLLSGRKFADAITVAQQYKDIFKDNYYLELHQHNMPEQAAVIQGMAEISRKLDIPFVATNDVHYLKKSDARNHDILLCISTNKSVNDPSRMRMSVQEFYFKPESEMRAIFKEFPQAVDNTTVIAGKCNLELNFRARHLPRYTPPEGKTPTQYLRELCDANIHKRYPQMTDKITKRLTEELANIEKMGFIDYFLVVCDFVRYAKEHGISVGPGRGSAAGSIVSYILGITDIDPLKYELLFERFINPGRNEPPDIDIDFSQAGRDDVIKYVRNKYGAENVAQIITFGTMKARAAVRDVGRALAVPLIEVDRIAKKINAQTLRESINQDPELKEMFERPPRKEIRDLFAISQKLEGLVRHASTHAAGVVIADKTLDHYVPIYSNEGVETTQYDMESLQSIGLLKVDLLGIVTLDVIEKCIAAIRQSTGKQIDINTIGLDDKKAYQLLCRAETKGVFQLESGGMRDLVQKLKPDRFEDIIALVALYRPGPLQSGMVDKYIRCKHGTEEISYQHPALEPILKETNGVILYQEQVMMIAHQLGGFTLSEGDDLRKAMGKKIPDIMQKHRDKFVAGAVKNKISDDTAHEIFNLMEYFGGYGFNKSHSTAYALTAYRTAYLKANYPAEYMAALMTCHRGDTDKIVDYVDECKRMGIRILVPDINASNLEFTATDKGIRFGLGAVKNVGDKAVGVITAERDRNGPYKSFYDFCERVDLRAADKSVLESLIKGGALDSFGLKRSVLINSLEEILSIAGRHQHDKRTGQLALMGKSETTATAGYPTLPDSPELPEEDLLRFEKDILGFYITGHPLAQYEKLLKELTSTTIGQLAALKQNAEVKIGGVLTNIRLAGGEKSKFDKTARERYAYFKLRDLTGVTDAAVYSEEFKRYRSLVHDNKIVLLKGRLDLSKGTPLVKVKEMSPLERAYESMPNRVTINITLAGFEDGAMEGLKDILLAHPGTCPVFLEMNRTDNSRVLLKVGSDYSVTISDRFREDIDELLGTGRLELK